jgi:hypothetical protein
MNVQDHFAAPNTVCVSCLVTRGKLEAKNVLQSLWGSYLRAAVGSVETTTEVLVVALWVTPLDLAVTGQLASLHTD